MARLSGGVRKNFNRGVIRPPGSVAEDEFLRRCIKCDQCIRVCPTNVLQPALFEAGLEGLWTPIMISKMGWCELNCTLCSQVCPTGAIREISIAEKLGIGPFEGKGPIKTGTAFYNQGRCLPWAMDTELRRLRGGLPGQPQGDLHPQRRGHRPLGRDHRAQAAVHRPGQVHRLRHLRARVPRQGRPGRLRHRHRRNSRQEPLAPALAGRRRGTGLDLGLRKSSTVPSPAKLDAASTNSQPEVAAREADETLVESS